MYTEKRLSRYPYFSNVLKNNDIARVVDSLTGAIQRPYIIGFIRDLIDHKIPFTMGLIDLDNFKSINDNYGHKIGDGVLKGVASDLIEYLDDYGVLGRIGGDEFLLVNTRDIEYDDKKQFFLKMYEDYHGLRKNIPLGQFKPFITGTIGSATYPNDAQDYDTLFAQTDKTLYRGKTKGRNCYIIYVKEKHENIQIKEITKHEIYQTMRSIKRAFDYRDGLREKLEDVYDSLKNDMRISDLFYINRDHILYSVMDKALKEPVGELEELMEEDAYTSHHLERISYQCPQFYNAMALKELETVLVVKIGVGDTALGYLMCAEAHNKRIWQDDDKAVLYFVSCLIAGYIGRSGKDIH